jgi:integrase
MLPARKRRSTLKSTAGRAPELHAIRYAHRLADFEPPTNSEHVRATLRGIRRTVGGAPARKAPVLAETARAMALSAPEGLKGLRDRALLPLGFAGAFRRSELVALDVADLEETDDGFKIVIRRSKTDQEGHGTTIAIVRGHHARPVKAVKAWLAACGISERLSTSGRLGDIAADLTRASWIMKKDPRKRARVKVEGCCHASNQFAAKSLRAGYRPEDYRQTLASPTKKPPASGARLEEENSEARLRKTGGPAPGMKGA